MDDHRPRLTGFAARDWLNFLLALALLMAPFVAYAALFG